MSAFARAACAALVAMVFIGGCSTPPTTRQETTVSLDSILAGTQRSDAHKARDQYRHPKETLLFFGIQPGMTVVEVWPSTGWWTEILAPLLKDGGAYYAAYFPTESKNAPGYMKEREKAYDAMLKARPELYGRVVKTKLLAPEWVAMAPHNSADMVLTFRNAHDWLNDSPQTLDAVFKAAYKVLKPGGVLGFTDHRARPFADAVQSSKALHRIPEDYIIEAGLRAGFRLAGVSEINANPKDPEDINIHRLPPDLSGPDSEHAKMKAIGESDRMTMKFVKPLRAAE